MKKKVEDNKIRSVINRLYREKENGFYVYAKGEITDLGIITKYLARYSSRPAIAESRIVEYDGKRVTIKYTPHGETKEVQETMSASEFIERLIIHIPDTNFKMIRNYGIYARNNQRARRIERRLITREQYLRIKQTKTWQLRLMLDYNRNPLKCSCGTLMKRDDIVVPWEREKIERYKWKGQNAG